MSQFTQIRQNVHSMDNLMDQLWEGLADDHPARQPDLLGESYMDRCPEEVILHILKYLQFRDKKQLVLVNKLFRRLAFQDVFSHILYDGFTDDGLRKEHTDIMTSLHLVFSHGSVGSSSPLLLQYLSSPKLAHVNFDWKWYSSSDWCTIRTSLEGFTFPHIKSLQITVPFNDFCESCYPVNIDRIIQAFPNITALNIPTFKPVGTITKHITKNKLEILYIHRTYMDLEVINTIVTQFPNLHTLIFERPLHSSLTYHRFIQAMNKLKHLDVLVMPFPAGFFSYFGLDFAFRFTTITRHVLVRETEYRSVIAVLQPRGKDKWVYKWMFYASLDFWKEHLVRHLSHNTIYTHSWKAAIGAWPEAAPSPFDVNSH